MADTELPEISIITSVERESKSEKTDPFLIKAAEARKLNGLSKRFVGEVTRKFLRGTGAASKQEEIEAVTGYDVFQVVSPPYDLINLGRVYESISSFNYAAVNAKVFNIVGLGYDFVESKKMQRLLDSVEDQKRLSRMRKRIAKVKDEVSEWLDSCNEEDTFTETLIKVYTDREATGNGYLEIGRTVDGRIGYIGHIPAASIRVRSNRDGFVQLISTKSVFFRNFGDRETPDPIGGDPNPNEIIHLKNYSPTNTFYGVPDIMAAPNALAGNEFAGRFNLDYFEHRAAPRYVVVVKGARLSKDSQKELFEFLSSSLRGKNHRSIVVPLPADIDGTKVEFKMEAVEAGIQEGSFKSYKKDNRDEILMAHRTPISKIGMAEGVALAAARDADKTFREQVTSPAQKILEKKLNRIIAELTDVVVLKLNEMTLTDEDTQSKIDERYLRMQVVTPNEVRARKGMPSIKGGDKVVRLNAQAKAESTAQATGNRQRDQQRAANSPDQSGEARNPQGEGAVVG